jgi:triosephosphate isomerase
MRKKIVAGNWKMNLNKSEADILYNDLESKSYPDDVEVVIAPASLYLDSFSNASKVSISSKMFLLIVTGLLLVNFLQKCFPQ